MDVGPGDAGWEQVVQQGSTSLGQGAKSKFVGVCFRCQEPGHYAFACK
jgi:hypothetical protein